MSDDKQTKNYKNKNDKKKELDASKEVISESEITTYQSQEQAVRDEANTEQSIDNAANKEASFDQPLENANPVENPEADTSKKKSKINYYKIFYILCTIGFFVFTALFVNDLFVQPYLTNRSLAKIDALYTKPSLIPTPYPTAVATDPVATPTVIPVTVEISPTPDPPRDDKGRLLQFSELLNENEDVKGWITIPDSNMDLVVMQSDYSYPEYYLTKDIYRNYLKAGSLFLDKNSSVENGTQNLVIHGHNMTSTDNMFHYLIYFKELDYYRERPVFTFDTILKTGQWKIFSIFITNGTSKEEALFDYTKATFTDSSDFLNFVYQLRIRSLFQIDNVDINENDELLTLSTCSYEVKDYRTVIVARKIREGEAPSVDVDSVTMIETPLYPYSWYYQYGGKAPPKLAPTFEEALEAGDINWYTPVTEE